MASRGAALPSAVSLALFCAVASVGLLHPSPGLAQDGRGSEEIKLRWIEDLKNLDSASLDTAITLAVNTLKAAAKDKNVAATRFPDVDGFHRVAVLGTEADVTVIREALSHVPAASPSPLGMYRIDDLPTKEDPPALDAAISAVTSILKPYGSNKTLTITRLPDAGGFHHIAVYGTQADCATVRQMLVSTLAFSPGVPTLHRIDDLPAKDDSAALDAAIGAVTSILKPEGSKKTLLITRLPDAGGFHHLAVYATEEDYVTARDMLAQGLAPSPGAPTLQWIDEFRNLDSVALDAAVKTAESMLKAGDASKTPCITRMPDLKDQHRIAVYGTKADYDLVYALLSRVPAAQPAPLVRRWVELRPGILPSPDPAKPGLVERILNNVGLRRWTYVQARPTRIMLQGTDRLAAEAVRQLVDGELVFDDRAPTSQYVRLHYDRSSYALSSILQGVQGKLGTNVGVAADASAPTDATTPSRPYVTLTGPRGDVRQLKRVIARFDTARPQVTLDLWVFQLSGRAAKRVQENTQAGQEAIDTVAALLRQYSAELSATASTLLGPPKSDPLNRARFYDDTEGDKVTEWGESVWVPALEPGKVAQTKVSYGILRRDANEAPLSLTETLMAAFFCDTPGDPTKLKNALEDHLSSWIISTKEDRPSALKAWRDLLHDSSSERAQSIAQLLDAVLAGQDPKNYQWGPLLPVAFLAALEDPVPEHAQAARRAVRLYLTEYEMLEKDWDAVDPDDFSRHEARTQATLEKLEQGLTRDVEQVFLSPLREAVQRIAGSGSPRRNGSGLGAGGHASVTVLSDAEATITGSAVSYFDVTQSPKLDQTVLDTAKNLGDSLGGLFPAPAAGKVVETFYLDPTKVTPDALTALQSNLSQLLSTASVMANAFSTSLTVIGTRQDIEAARATLDSMQVLRAATPPQGEGLDVPFSLPVPGGGMTPLSGLGGAVAGVPMDRLLALALAMGEPDTVWETLTDGAKVAVTPHILPGADAAELDLTFTVTHEAPSASGTQAESTKIPLSRVAKHDVTTTVYAKSLDLFSLSSFALQVSAPRPDLAVPILSQIPLLGRMFRFPRGPQTVHHESLMLVSSTIVPTPTEVANVLVAVPTKQ